MAIVTGSTFTSGSRGGISYELETEGLQSVLVDDAGVTSEWFDPQGRLIVVDIATAEEPGPLSVARLIGMLTNHYELASAVTVERMTRFSMQGGDSGQAIILDSPDQIELRGIGAVQVGPSLGYFQLVTELVGSERVEQMAALMTETGRRLQWTVNEGSGD